jgi:hypothetical protein
MNLDHGSARQARKLSALHLVISGGCLSYVWIDTSGGRLQYTVSPLEASAETTILICCYNPVSGVVPDLWSVLKDFHMTASSRQCPALPSYAPPVT